MPPASRATCIARNPGRNICLDLVPPEPRTIPGIR
jgi:hypothetical protein